MEDSKKLAIIVVAVFLGSAIIGFLITDYIGVVRANKFLKQRIDECNKKIYDYSQ